MQLSKKRKFETTLIKPGLPHHHLKGQPHSYLRNRDIIKKMNFESVFIVIISMSKPYVGSKSEFTPIYKILKVAGLK